MTIPEFLSPIVSIVPVGDKWQALASDGRELLEAPVEREVLERETAVSVMGIVMRNLIQVLPMLKQVQDTPDFIRIPYEIHKETRFIALLKGQLKYITLPRAKDIIGFASMKVVKASVSAGEIETFRMCGAHSYALSADGLAKMFPEHERKIRVASKVAGAGFPIDDAYGIARDYGAKLGFANAIPIETERPPDKRERKDYTPNELPEPPEFPVGKHVKSNFPLVQAEKRIEKYEEACLSGKATALQRFQKHTANMLRKAEERVYKIGNREANRYQMMEYLVWYSGCTDGLLSTICTGLNGTPTMMEVHQWKEMHPDFAHKLALASEVQAEILADAAIEEVKRVTCKDEVSVARLKHDALVKRAALQSERFRDKKVIQTEDLDNRNVKDLQRQLESLLMQSPELITVESIETQAENAAVADAILGDDDE